MWRSIFLVPIALLILSAWGFFGLTRHAIVAIDNWGNAGAAIASDGNAFAATLANVNRPCKGMSGPDACGTLAQINKTVVKVGDAIVTTQLQERDAAPHLIVAMDALNDSAHRLGGTADALTAMAVATTGSADTLTATLGDAGATIRDARPLLASFTESGDALNALLKRKAITDLTDNLAGVTGHLNGITGDLQKVADKTTADYLKPVPWYMQPIKKGGELIDIGAAIARHTP